MEFGAVDFFGVRMLAWFVLTILVSRFLLCALDSPDSYQKLMEAQDRLEAIEGIRRGLASAERGEGWPAGEVFEKFRRKHKIPRGA